MPLETVPTPAVRSLLLSVSTAVCAPAAAAGIGSAVTPGAVVLIALSSKRKVSGVIGDANPPGVVVISPVKIFRIVTFAATGVAAVQTA